eukprot:16441802-Heterocapsa_arctica.AAC.1
MCARGAWQVDDQGLGLIEQTTGFLTNSPSLAGERRSGDHRHIHLMGGRVSDAQVQSEKLRRAICTG